MGLLAIMSLAANASAGSVPELKGKRVIEPFNYHGVTLGGSLRRQFDEVCEYYLRIPNDDLLKAYRERAGKPAPGADLGGCYISHNPFGQFLAGYSRMYAATGDRVNKDKAIALMNGWAVLVRPFYVFKEGERYFLYLDPSKEASLASYKAAKYSANWTDFGSWMTTSIPGSSAEHSFAGAGIRVHYFKYDDAGRFEVTIDDKVIGVLDEYGPKRGEPAFADYTGLTAGRHTIRFKLLPDMSPESKGLFANLSAFESLP